LSYGRIDFSFDKSLFVPDAVVRAFLGTESF